MIFSLNTLYTIVWAIRNDPSKKKSLRHWQDPYEKQQ